MACGTVAADEIARGEHVEPVTFSLVDGMLPAVAARAAQGQVIGRHPGLLEQRRHQAIGDARDG